MDTPLQWNDPQIPDEDSLYRRVPNRPDYYFQRDLLDSSPVIGRNAFQFDDDGMSVYRDGLVIKHSLTLRQIRRNVNSLLFKFTVGAVRALLAGVIDSVDEDDSEIGVAHGLVRSESGPKPPRPIRKKIQDGLVQAAEHVIVEESQASDAGPS